MIMDNVKKAAISAGAVAVIAGGCNGREKDKAAEELIAKIKDSDAEVRTKAWLSAGQVGAAAVEPLAKVMTDEDLEVARAAKRGLWKVVRDAGRPGRKGGKRAVVGKLNGLLGDDQPIAVRREVLWMLSEIGDAKSVKPIAALLSNKLLREDARMVLERIGDEKCIAALKAGLKAAPEDFKLNIAQSLRSLGQKVPGLACVKLVPTKKTNVKPL